MNTDTLSTVLADPTLEQPARLLYATLYACAPSGAGALPVGDLLARLGLRTTGALRRLRRGVLRRRWCVQCARAGV